MNDTKLKPCPFCGGEGHINEIKNHDVQNHVYKVYCTKCICSTRWDYSPDRAAETWNRRTLK